GSSRRGSRLDLWLIRLGASLQFFLAEFRGKIILERGAVPGCPVAVPDFSLNVSPDGTAGVVPTSAERVILGQSRLVRKLDLREQLGDRLTELRDIGFSASRKCFDASSRDQEESRAEPSQAAERTCQVNLSFLIRSDQERMCQGERPSRCLATPDCCRV